MESVSLSPKVSKAVSKRIVNKDWLWARETGWIQTSRSSLVQPQEWALKGYWENILRNKEYSGLSFPFPNYCKDKRREKCLFHTCDLESGWGVHIWVYWIIFTSRLLKAVGLGQQGLLYVWKWDVGNPPELKLSWIWETQKRIPVVPIAPHEATRK